MAAELNQLSRIVENIKKVPGPLRSTALSVVLGRVVKFIGTSKLQIIEMKRGKVHIRVANRKIVQNHIGGVHAAAMALLAETATGFVVGMAVPDDRTPVIKSMKVEYQKRTQGALEAVATLSEEELQRITDTEKGEITVPVTVTDESGREPIQCEMVWAWVPKRRKS